MNRHERRKEAAQRKAADLDMTKIKYGLFIAVPKDPLKDPVDFILYADDKGAFSVEETAAILEQLAADLRAGVVVPH